jgi:hypothetical protein
MTLQTLALLPHAVSTLMAGHGRAPIPALADGDETMTTTDFTGTQLATILSALDGQTRNPASKAAALAAIRRHAGELGCTVEDILEAAAGLLDGRMNADDFRAALRDDGATDEPGDDAAPDVAEQDEDAPVAATAALQAEPAENETNVSPCQNGTRSVKQQLLAACQAAEHWLRGELDRPGETRPDDILRVLHAAIERAQGQPRRATTGKQPKPPRADTKQARLIAMLHRGASTSDMTRELGWLRHTCHGALAGLKKKRGLEIVSDKHAGGERIYRLAAPVEKSGTSA